VDFELKTILLRGPKNGVHYTLLQIECLESRITPAFNLTIGTGTTANVLHDSAGNFTAASSGANINVADIRADLLAGKNVTISNGLSGGETGTITWQAASDLDYNGIGAAGLQLNINADPSTQAAAGLFLNSKVFDSNLASADALSVSISAQHDLTVSNIIAAGSGTILLKAGAAGSGSGTLHLTSTAAVNSMNGSGNGVTLRGADMDIQPGSSVSSTGTRLATFVRGTIVMNDFISGLTGPTFDAVDGQGNLYVSIPTANAVDEFSSTGAPLGSFTSHLSDPQGVAVDSSGNLYVASAGNDSIFEFLAGSSFPLPTGALATGLSDLQGLAVNAGGSVFATLSNEIYEVGVGQVHASVTLSGPRGLAFSPFGDLYVADTGDSQIIKFSFMGPRFIALASAPEGVAVDFLGNVYATLANGTVYEVGPGVLTSGLSGPVGVAAIPRAIYMSPIRATARSARSFLPS